MGEAWKVNKWTCDGEMQEIESIKKFLTKTEGYQFSFEENQMVEVREGILKGKKGIITKLGKSEPWAVNREPWAVRKEQRIVRRDGWRVNCEARNWIFHFSYNKKLNGNNQKLFWS